MVVGLAVIYGIVVGISIDLLGYKEPVYIQVAHAEEVKKEVRIEVVMEHTTEAIETKIREVFPEQPNTMVAIAKCESQLRAEIQSEHILWYGREESYGVFQIHARVWDEKAVELGYKNYRTNALENIMMARYIYDTAGIDKWMCYTKGLYLNYL